MMKIRELRRERGITLKELGKTIGVAESTMSLYETQKRQPDYETLLKLVEYFDCSLDYILGRSSSRGSLDLIPPYKNKEATPEEWPEFSDEIMEMAREIVALPLESKLRVEGFLAAEREINKP